MPLKHRQRQRSSCYLAYLPQFYVLVDAVFFRISFTALALPNSASPRSARQSVFWPIHFVGPFYWHVLAVLLVILLAFLSAAGRCGFDFGGAGGWALASLGFICGFSGMISAVGSGAREVDLDGVSGAAGAGFGGGGGAAVCAWLLAVLLLRY